jgi:hypothetical protein
MVDVFVQAVCESIDKVRTSGIRRLTAKDWLIVVGAILLFAVIAVMVVGVIL